MSGVNKFGVNVMVVNGGGVNMSCGCCRWIGNEWQLGVALDIFVKGVSYGKLLLAGWQING